MHMLGYGYASALYADVPTPCRRARPSDRPPCISSPWRRGRKRSAPTARLALTKPLQTRFSRSRKGEHRLRKVSCGRFDGGDFRAVGPKTRSAHSAERLPKGCQICSTPSLPVASLMPAVWRAYGQAARPQRCQGRRPCPFLRFEFE